MNTKSLLACLLILALFTSAVQGLLIKKTQNHKAARHMAKKFLTGLNHQMFLAFHGQTDNHVDGHIDEQAQVPDGPLVIIPPKPDFISDFTSFALGDDEIFGSIAFGKPLSPEAAQRVKDFVKNNKNFNNEMLQMFQDPNSPDCVKDLSEDKQRKIIGIIVDNLDFLSLLGGESSDDSGVSDETVGNIEKAIRNDPDLGDNVAQCYDENKDSLKSIA